MPHCLRFELLGADHARAVARLAGAEPGAADGADPALSLGLLDGARVAGCVLARAAPHGRRGEPGDTLCVSQLAVAPAYASCADELLARWRDLVVRQHPHAPLEISAASSDAASWRARHEPVFADLGYRLAALEPSGGRILSRFEPSPPPSVDPRALPVLASYEIAGARYDVRALRSETHWSRLEPDWDALLARTPNATGLQSYAYLRTWWRCFGLPHRLWILTIWRDGALCGIAPLRIKAERSRFGWVREVGFLGTSWEVDRPGLLVAEHVEPCSQALQRCLTSSEALWDYMYIYEQDPDGPFVRALAPFAADPRYQHVVSPDLVHPYLRLDRTFEAYLTSRSRNFRKHARANRRKLESRGELRVERARDEPHVRAAIARYLELEDRSWKRGTSAAVGDPRRSRFIGALVDSLAPKGTLQVLELTVGSQLIASAIAFVHARIYYSLQIAHDEAWSAYSPGNVLTYLELEECHSGAYAELDFLGGYLDNKLQWTATARETIEIHLLRRSRLHQLWSVQLAPRLRRALERLGLLRLGMRLHGRLVDRLEKFVDGDGDSDA